MKNTSNYGLNKPETTDYYNVDDFNQNSDIIDAKLKELDTPTYTAASANTALTSGEKLTVAFGKIAKAVSSLISHLANTSNPHGVTKAQVNLGNVENKSSATIRGELTKANVTTALGYTPPTTDTTYSNATTSASGLMSASDKTKLNGIATGANKTTVDSGLSSTSTNPVQNKVVNTAIADAKQAGTTAQSNLSSHVGNKSNPHGVTAAQVGARPDTWMPSASDVGARPDTWTPTATDVGALPISGGTLTGGELYFANGYSRYLANSGAVQFETWNVIGDSSDRRTIFLQNSSKQTTAKAVRFIDKVDGAEKYYALFGEHNKPKGTYSGNGSTASRTIETGGIGNAIVVWSGTVMAMVTPAGGYLIGASGLYRLGKEKAIFKDGVLTLTTNEDSLNYNGSTYTYQVL